MLLVFAMCARLDMTAYHVDFTAAYLYEPYTGPILCVRPANNYVGSARYPGKVTKLERNIYGLPDAAKRFMDGLKAHVHRKGYTRLKTDVSVYSKRDNSKFLVMAVTISMSSWWSRTRKTFTMDS